MLIEDSLLITHLNATLGVEKIFCLGVEFVCEHDRGLTIVASLI